MSEVRNAGPKLASRDPTSASVARPSWPSRWTTMGAAASPAGTSGSPGSSVVSATAAMPSSRNDALLARREGNREVDELRRGGRQEGRPPDLLLDSRRGGADERPRRGRGAVPRDREARSSSAPDAVQDDRDVGVLRERRLLHEALRAGAAVRARIRRDEDEVLCGNGAGADSCGAKLRASSMSAAVPEALSPYGRPAPALSRCATTMVASWERPGTTATMFRSSISPRSGRSARQTSSSVSRPNDPIVSVNQRAASADSSEPGTRDGYTVVSSSASEAAEVSSKRGSSGGRWSWVVVETENRKARRAGATTIAATRTSRAFSGRSTVPRRTRRRCPRGRAASIAGL